MQAVQPLQAVIRVPSAAGRAALPALPRCWAPTRPQRLLLQRVTPQLPTAALQREHRNGSERNPKPLLLGHSSDISIGKKKKRRELRHVIIDRICSSCTHAVLFPRLCPPIYFAATRHIPSWTLASTRQSSSSAQLQGEHGPSSHIAL